MNAKNKSSADIGTCDSAGRRGESWDEHKVKAAWAWGETNVCFSLVFCRKHFSSSYSTLSFPFPYKHENVPCMKTYCDFIVRSLVEARKTMASYLCSCRRRQRREHWTRVNYFYVLSKEMLSKQWTSRKEFLRGRSGLFGVLLRARRSFRIPHETND